MSNLFSTIYEYIKSLFLETWHKIFLFADLFGLFLILFPQISVTITGSYALSRMIGVIIIILSFVVSNYLVFANLYDKISEGADIKIKVINSILSPSTGSIPSPFSDDIHHANGYRENGLPDWISLWMKLKLMNIGFENGRVKINIDKTKIAITKLLDSKDCKIELHHYEDVLARKSSSIDLFIYFPISEKEPKIFSKKLKEIITKKEQFRITFFHWTDRIDEIQKERSFSITGDYSKLGESIFQQWTDYGPKELLLLE